MRVLLSAYACEPGLGSEAAVGWGWASHLAGVHDVHVITRESNRKRIEHELTHRAIPNLHVHYFDLPPWLRRWKKGNRGVHLYYLLWQYGAYRRARKLARDFGFDVVHHVTFVSARFPSFMGRLGIPFVFGPVAGGEAAPAALWWPLGCRARILETLRNASSHWVRCSYLMGRTFAAADCILTTSPQSTRLVPARFLPKASEMLGIALGRRELEEFAARSARNAEDQGDAFRIFFAGRFLYWKGMTLGLNAFARLKRQVPRAQLTMIGDGPERAAWQALAERLDVADSVHWIAQLPRPQFLDSLASFDVLLFPSLHDSGGMVVLEAMAAGVPPVCLDIGGPGQLVDDHCGSKVPPTTWDDTVAGLHEALVTLASDKVVWKSKSRAAVARANEMFTWTSKAHTMGRLYEAAMRAQE